MALQYYKIREMRIEFLDKSEKSSIYCSIPTYDVLLVIQLGGQPADVLLLASDQPLRLLLGPLEVGDRVLGHLELALHLPAGFLDNGSRAFFLVQTSLELVEGRLEFGLDRVEMLHLLLGRGQVVAGLGLVLGDVLLLLVGLVDALILTGDLVVETLDGVVPVGLLLLDLLDGCKGKGD